MAQKQKPYHEITKKRKHEIKIGGREVKSCRIEEESGRLFNIPSTEPAGKPATREFNPAWQD